MCTNKLHCGPQSTNKKEQATLYTVEPIVFAAMPVCPQRVFVPHAGPIRRPFSVC